MKLGIFSAEFVHGSLPCAAAILLLLLPGTQSRAATITYTATNLADTTPGEDLWAFSYILDGFTFALNQGFTIFFDDNLFTKLQTPPPPVNAAWDVLTVQPDLALGSNGFYDGLALSPSPSLVNPFRVNFVWLGVGTPGSQSFTIYNPDFSTVIEGQTVEEPKGPISIRMVTAGARIRFDTVEGRFYRLEYNDQLNPGEWRPLIDDVLGDGLPMFKLDTTATQVPQRFYRVVESSAPIWIRPTPSGVRVTFATVMGRIYKVEYSNDLSPAGWQTLIDNVLGDGLPAVTVDAAATALPRRFYRRVETQPAPP